MPYNNNDMFIILKSMEGSFDKQNQQISEVVLVSIRTLPQSRQNTTKFKKDIFRD